MMRGEAACLMVKYGGKKSSGDIEDEKEDIPIFVIVRFGSKRKYREIVTVATLTRG